MEGRHYSAGGVGEDTELSLQRLEFRQFYKNTITRLLEKLQVGVVTDVERKERIKAEPLKRALIVNDPGNPGVKKPDPYPYPCIPVPVDTTAECLCLKPQKISLFVN